MTGARWWLVGVVWLLVAAGTLVGGDRAGVLLGLPAYLVTLLAARTGLADRRPQKLPAATDPKPGTFTPVDRVDSALAWGTNSDRLFDRATRPRLQRALRAALAERGLDLDRDREQVRQLLGERAWYLLDPARPARDHSDGGGVDRAGLEDLITRVENIRP